MFDLLANLKDLDRIDRDLRRLKNLNARIDREQRNVRVYDDAPSAGRFQFDKFRALEVEE